VAGREDIWPPPVAEPLGISLEEALVEMEAAYLATIAEAFTDVLEDPESTTIAAFGGADSEDATGRCAAILSNGKRCPNGALPGSRFCGVPAHQELAAKAARGEDISASIVQPAVEAVEEEEPEEVPAAAVEVAAGEEGESAAS